MYAYIKGTLTYKHKDYLVVEANGLGYKIYTSLATIDRCGSIGDEIKLYTYLHIREDAIMLFGFLTQEELGMFEMLITVSGVGPKVALSIISSISPSRFGLAVIADDAKALTRVPGVGLKTAQRIILELKDKIKKEQIDQNAAIDGQAELADVSLNNNIAEAMSALIVLGYTHGEAKKAVSAVYTDGMDVEQIVKGALKVLVR